MSAHLPVAEAEFYRRQSVVTDPGASGRAMLVGLPADPSALARVVRGLLIHRLEEQRFDVQLDPRRLHHDAETRYVEDVLWKVSDRCDAPLTERREPADRFVGTCRDFVVVHVAMLRNAGIPARARAGTSTYFSPHHWVTEYWEPAHGWKLIDPQLTFGFDEEGYGFPFDPYDIDWSTFTPGGLGWQQARAAMARQDRADSAGTELPRPPSNELPSWHILIGDVQLDLAALNKTEMLPWDVWGAMDLADSEEPDPQILALLDDVAAMTRPPAGPLAELQRLFTANDQMRVPTTFASCTTYLGTRKVTLRPRVS